MAKLDAPVQKKSQDGSKNHMMRKWKGPQWILLGVTNISEIERIEKLQAMSQKYMMHHNLMNQKYGVFENSEECTARTSSRTQHAEHVS